MKKVLLAIVLICSFAGSGIAQIEEKSSDLSAYVGMVKSLDVDVKLTVEGYEGTQEGTVEGDSEIMFGARYSYNVDPNSAIEGTFGLALPENSKIYLYHVNYRYNITTSNEKIFPFVTGGVGAITVSPDQGEGDTNLSFNAGGGLGFFVAEKVAVRADVRDHFMRRGETEGQAGGAAVKIDGYTQQNLEFSGGVSYYFY